ncbi:hypothetical protein Hsw_2064 [Hymenobacter swuensis DY53]|uniref:Uncharacterized protein n=1 Tax=Hymenobacter swuensis DY53 TaxID=1227739 RepID=W8EX48_9BACT|nr:hypothetical protein Hsw_2064 [Hymenobacter swuensis DY53]
MLVSAVLWVISAAEAILRFCTRPFSQKVYKGFIFFLP